MAETLTKARVRKLLFALLAAEAELNAQQRPPARRSTMNTDWQGHHGSQGGQGRSGKDVSGAGLALAICVVLFLVLVGLAALGVG